MTNRTLLRRSALLIGIAAGVSMASVAGVEGVWLVANEEAHVELRACGDALCGEIVRLREPRDEHGRVRLDRNNPEERLRRRPILGLEILQGLKPSAEVEGLWVGGTIYDPESGRTYRCKLRLDGEDRIKMRGFWGISLLGKTTHWTRVAPWPPEGR